MMLRIASLAAAATTAVVAIDNGKGITPPLMWRSWNLYGFNVNQELIMSQMDGITSRARTVNGNPTSLSDLGYKDVGLDDNWQACGSYGPNKYTYHDATGRPVVNQERFPDFIAMTTYAHQKNLTAGWYGNNCECSDHCTDVTCYEGDVHAALDYGFDSIKLDGCGRELDLTLFAQLFNESGKSIMIENCHWGGTVPNATWCPWNYFRSSGDIEASYDSVVRNLQTTIQWAKSGLSAPGCWAYPDMLEVGVAPGVHPGEPGLTDIESRSHFGAWCIVSSPLTLSHDMNNDTVTDSIWDIITNTEAIAVNQAWDGFSGSVFAQSSVTTPLLRECTKNTVGECLRAAPTWQFWNKPVGGGKVAVLLMNHATTTQTLSLDLTTVPGLNSQSATGRDIWARADIPTITNYYNVTLASHDSAFVVLTPA